METSHLGYENPYLKGSSISFAYGRLLDESFPPTPVGLLLPELSVTTDGRLLDESFPPAPVGLLLPELSILKDGRLLDESFPSPVVGMLLPELS
jgi:hypothetical protein